MSYIDKRIYNNKLLGLVQNCDTCKGPAKRISTGYAYRKAGSDPYWLLEFQCEVCSEYSTTWSNEYETKIHKIIKEEKIIPDDCDRLR